MNHRYGCSNWGWQKKKVSRLTDNRDWIESFVVSPDGARVIALHGRSLRFTYDARIRPAVWLHDLGSGQKKQLLGDKPPAINGMVWTLDGKGVYLTVAQASHAVYRDAYVLEPSLLDVASGELQPVALNWNRGLGRNEREASAALAATPDGFVAILADGVHNRLARFTRGGPNWKQAFISGEQVNHLSGFCVSTNADVMVYVHSRANVLPQLFAARLEGSAVIAPRALTKLNLALAKKHVGRVEVVRWRGANGVEIEGLLHYPLDYRAGQKHPLVVTIHGGPFAVDRDLWKNKWGSAESLFTTRGAFVFQPNYQGSSGYGLAFAESLAGGKYYDLPVDDILKGIDFLVAQGWVDPEKIGTMGWSNGAILTMALLTRDQRFKAASAGAGGVEWTADTAVCDGGLAYSDYYFGATPWADPERYRRLSPFYQMDRITTPVLILQGMEDRVVPPHHAWMQFRVLQEHGKAPVRFVQLPGEPHNLGKISSQRRKLEEELAWFDRYLFRSEKDESPALKDGSPLASALRLRSASRDGARYGRMLAGKLVPEAVSFKELTVGRFEITQEQFMQFDPGFRVQAGRENYPAAGITIEQARAYCEWLSTLTGERWRLPNAAEADALYATPEDGTAENTLDYWAGYAANPEDTARLRGELTKLGGGGALLREVGSFGGRGEETPVFDLGGNVAEWTTDKQGVGTLRGGSADTPVDARVKNAGAALECRGFRVVTERP